MDETNDTTVTESQAVTSIKYRVRPRPIFGPSKSVTLVATYSSRVGLVS